MTATWVESDEELLRNAVARAAELERENDRLKDDLIDLEQERDNLQLQIEQIVKGVDRSIDDMVADIDKAIRG